MDDHHFDYITKMNPIKKKHLGPMIWECDMERSQGEKQTHKKFKLPSFLN